MCSCELELRRVKYPITSHFDKIQLSRIWEVVRPSKTGDTNARELGQ